MTSQERSGMTVPDSAAGPALLSVLRWAVTDRESHRSWTQVANDGIVATAGILEGFAGAGATSHTLVTAATTATVAGALSMGGTQWAVAAAERDGQLMAVEEETAELARQPEVERATVVAYYEEKGLSPELASRVADELMARGAVDAQLESEHGILEVMTRAETVRAGVGSTVAYLLGAAVPLAVTVAVPVDLESALILAAVVLSLIVTSVIGARTGRTNLSRTLVRALAVGLGTMAISYLVGRLVF